MYNDFKKRCCRRRLALIIFDKKDCQASQGVWRSFLLLLPKKKPTLTPAEKIVTADAIAPNNVIISISITPFQNAKRAKPSCEGPTAYQSTCLNRVILPLLATPQSDNITVNRAVQSEMTNSPNWLICYVLTLFYPKVFFK